MLKLDGLAKEEKNRANKIKNAETAISKIRQELSTEVKVESDEALNEEMVCML